MPILQSAPKSRVGTRKGAQKTFTPLDDTFINSLKPTTESIVSTQKTREEKKTPALRRAHHLPSPIAQSRQHPNQASPKPVIRHLPILVNLLPIGPHVTRALPDYTDTPLLAPAQLAIDALINPLEEPTT
jgi:hypothetical protein